MFESADNLATLQHHYSSLSLYVFWVDLITAWSIFNPHPDLVYKDFLLLPDLSGSGHQRRVIH